MRNSHPSAKHGTLGFCLLLVLPRVGFDGFERTVPFVYSSTSYTHAGWLFGNGIAYPLDGKTEEILKNPA